MEETQELHRDYRGECLCGAVRYRVRAAVPRAMYLCHCSRCRKESGSLHGANIFFADAELTWERGEERVTRFHLEGTRKSRAFCSTCGSPLPMLRESGKLVVPAGGLEDGAGLRPTAHLFCASAADWEPLAADAQRFDELPD